MSIARLVLVAGLLLTACGGSSSSPAQANSGAPAEPPRPKDAAQIAQTLVGGRVSGLVWIERVRSHSLGPKVLALAPVRDLLEGTSVDPLQDLDRVFVTGPSASEGRAVMFGEHRLDEARIPSVVADLVAKSEPPGHVLARAPYPAVRVQRKKFSGVVAFIPPRFVVAVPDDLAARLGSFERTGGLPDATGPEAARLVAVDPHRTLRAPGVPRVPETISVGEAVVVLRPDGGATIEAAGQSTAPEQAAKDAQRLTSSIDDATSVSLGPIRIRAFRPIVFSPRGDRVVSRVDLSRAEVDQLLGLASRFIPD